MNREIEFRAWLKNSNKMVEVEEIDFILQKQIAYDEIEYRYTNKQPFHYTQLVDFDDIELMQYTGLKDKNGVKIFEGDIVKNIYTDLKYKVFWDDENVCYRLELIDNDLDYVELNIREAGMIEVIGNIYENKELLV